MNSPNPHPLVLIGKFQRDEQFSGAALSIKLLWAIQNIPT